MNIEQLKNIIEAAMLVSSKPMTLAHIEALFEHDESTPEPPAREQIREAITLLQDDYESRGIELVEVASGWRMQSRQEMAPWIANLFQEKAPRYSRALLETLVLVAYRQPITRSEIEDVRGVAVSANIVKTLIERDWVKVVGHRDVPGRPELLGTTKQFLDYFNLRKIGDLPTLSEIKSLDEIAPDLAREVAMLDPADAEQQADVDNTDGTDDQDNADQLSGGEVDVSGAGVSVVADSPEGAVSTDSEVGDELVDLADQGDSEEDHDSSVEAMELAESGEQVNEGRAQPVVDVELPLEQDSVDELEDGATEDNLDNVDSVDSLDDIDSDEDSLSVAEATIDAMSNVARPETELLH